MATDKNSCNILVSVLEAHGVREAVISPGSRNAPLITAVMERGFAHKVVIDERSAAFIALGKALSGVPVLLVCTSGTALLNYAPAVAEAYYAKVPLIVVSADRPAEWIDQDDSQTLRQFEALDHFVKRSYNIPSRCDDDNAMWYVNRVVNEACELAVGLPAGPVHINVQLDEPLNRQVAREEGRWHQRVITRVTPRYELDTDTLDRLGGKIAGRRVMVIAGFHRKSEEIDRALSQLSAHHGVVVMTETIANVDPVDGVELIPAIDRTLSAMDDETASSMRPDVVITYGGAIVSRFVKKYLREAGPEHWHVGLGGNVIDCMRCLANDIKMPAEDFFTILCGYMKRHGISADKAYGERWAEMARRSERMHGEWVNSLPWCDMTAMRAVMESIPYGANVHLSNGSVVRYAQLFPKSGDGISYTCNRGVSGIDGSTSTAIGDTRGDRLTLLITGDMSMQYDIGALAAPSVPPSFKVIVLCNGGGNIFRFVGGTASNPYLEECLVVNRPFPLGALAGAYGFAYYQVASMTDFEAQFPAFIEMKERPAIMALYTDGEVSASILSRYFELKLRQ